MTEDKIMGKFVKILLRQKSFNPGDVLQMIEDRLCNCLSLSEGSGLAPRLHSDFRPELQYSSLKVNECMYKM